VTKNKGLVRQRVRSLPDMAIPAAEPERWYPPEPDPELEYPVTIPILGLGRIIGRTQFDESHRMTEFALTAQIYYADAWWDVVRIDSDHGEVHAHYFHRKRDYADREVLLTIYSQNDVDTGYQMAEKLLVASWADHVQRWRGGS
jgi:hypothetical protein